MLPASTNNAVASQKMRTAVEKAYAVVQARRGVQFPDGRGLVDQLIGLNAWSKVTVLRLKSCGLREGRQRYYASTPRWRRSTFARMAWERAEGGRWQRLCALPPRLRRSTFTTMAWERVEGGRSQRHCASTPCLRRSTSARMT